MGGEVCELCGYVSPLGAIEIHYIVPREVTGQAGLSDSATVRLCRNCHREVHIWYSKTVSKVAYNLEAKRFRPPPPAEMVKEYEAAYKAFAEYKKGKRG